MLLHSSIGPARPVALLALTLVPVLVSSATLTVRAARAEPASRRAAMLAAGVDMTPVGTAKQAERAKAARAAKP